MKKNISTFITIILTISALLGNIKTTEAIYEYVDSSGNRTKACGETQEDCMTKFKDACPDIATYNANQICTMNSVATTCENNSYNIICPGSDIIQTAAQTTTTDSIINDKYKLLAPIGNLTEAPDNVGDYFNVIFKIIIGLCAVLAVIMIVIGGIQYMGSESIFGKTESKSRIMAAILGLLIALGAYALLNTINPDLLGGKGVTIKQVSAEIDEAPILSDINTPIPSGTSNSFTYCKGGVRKTAVKTKEGYMTFCSTYSSKLQLMISDAYHSSPSIVLSGGAFRDAASQIAARKNNCADVYNTPPNQCHPPTAKPGTSAHENGLAVDFTCDGKLINWQTNKNATDYQPKYSINQDTKKCFNWLSSNASKYGFKNYSKENWHWSTGDLAGH